MLLPFILRRADYVIPKKTTSDTSLIARAARHDLTFQYMGLTERE
jgi:hypothetical protein